DHDLHRLAAGEIFVAMNAAVLALGDLAADGLAVIDLAAISAEIVPAAVGILGDDAVGGADETRLVALMVARHRKFENIDRVAFDHVFENRTVIDIARRRRPQILHARVVALPDVDLALVFKRQAERKRDAFDGGKLPVERPEAFAIAGHVIEQNGGCGAAALFGWRKRYGG